MKILLKAGIEHIQAAHSMKRKLLKMIFLHIAAARYAEKIESAVKSSCNEGVLVVIYSRCFF